jgi:hypothetical protein
MKKIIIITLYLVGILSTSAKANLLPAESILQIRNDSIENQYINNECKTKKENSGFSYVCKNGSGGFVSLEVACNNYQVDYRFAYNVEYNFRCQNYKKNIYTTQNTYGSNFMNNNKIIYEKERNRRANNYVSAYK